MENSIKKKFTIDELFNTYDRNNINFLSDLNSNEREFLTKLFDKSRIFLLEDAIVNRKRTFSKKKLFMVNIKIHKGHLVELEILNDRYPRSFYDIIYHFPHLKKLIFRGFGSLSFRKIGQKDHINNKPNRKVNQDINQDINQKSIDNLEVLIIQNRKIHQLQNFPKKIPHLWQLVINYCNLKDLTFLPKENPNLCRLNLSNNNIFTLRSYSKFPSLVELNLSYNYIQSLEGIPLNFPRLKKIILRHNFLKNLINFPIFTPKIKEINLLNNPLLSLNGIWQIIPHLDILKIEQDKIKKFDGITPTTKIQFLKNPRKYKFLKPIPLFQKILKESKNLSYLSAVFNYIYEKDISTIIDELVEYNDSTNQNIDLIYWIKNREIIYERLKWELSNEDFYAILEKHPEIEDIINRIISE